MADPLVSELSESVQLALASAGASRDDWLAVLGLDARLARILSQVSEPMLAQMRIAWWRDQLNRPVEERQIGDAVLDLIGRTWNGREQALIRLVNGWEALLCEHLLTPDAASEFASGRSAAFVAIAEGAGSGTGYVAQAGRIWALADLASRTSNVQERSLVINLARQQQSGIGSLPRTMRPLAVLSGLAKRSLKRGGDTLIGDRLSPLVALRLGIFGR